uniref:Selenocysteine-specific elongation factor n=3 Tax=Clastoptera arizonana TaxID=38151 RepID=A0A1B6DV18_9HEMI
MNTKILNLNVGILGHVDSGKTSLAKVLSKISSTASFDKNPQSQERGITIDLGFSSLCLDLPDDMKNKLNLSCENLQFTFVDCPGHASLIRTVIGGAQIIDMMILVIDITKGMQTQTAECLIIGEITCSKMIVVLNKIDLVPETKREQTINKMKKKMKATLQHTKFKDVPILCTAAKPGGPEADITVHPIGVEELIESLKSFSFVPERFSSKPFVFSVDHCFLIKGQGTVMTGTILQGSVGVNNTVEIPSLNVTKKIKSMQVYRKSVEKAEQGDRVGICITQLDAKLLERCILCQPGYVPLAYAVIINANMVKYFKTNISSKAKFHVSIGHETVLGKITIFGSRINLSDKFDFSYDYLYQNVMHGPEDDEPDFQNVQQFVLIEFEKPVFVVPHSLVIGSKLDLDINTSTCRLAFYGNVKESIEDKNYVNTILPKLKLFKFKTKTGTVDRVVNEFELIVKNLFKKETKLELFLGLKVNLSSGEEGVIEQSFGQSGKVRIRVPQGLHKDTINKYANKKSKSSVPEIPENKEPTVVVLKFKSYVYDVKNKITQD